MANIMSIDAAAQNELAYEMVVELLAHQFAFPVRWTDTQDALLGAQKVERMVEIGPANTLTVMAKRTLGSKYKDHDLANSLPRELLCSSSNETDIYYDQPLQDDAPFQNRTANPAPAVSAKDAPPVTSTRVSTSVAVSAKDDVVISTTEVTAVPSPADVAMPTPGSRGMIPDSPITPTLILRSLIAAKLKKPITQVRGTDSIKSLAGGRSTLENEIVGDLLSEFGNLPDRPEERSIDQLAQDLQPSFSNGLGRESSSLISKTMSSKMPGGFGLTAAKQYLESHWGLPEGHQSAILLAAASEAPEKRIADEGAAKGFIDKIVSEYAQQQGIVFNSSSDQAVATQPTSNVDPEAMRRAQQKQTALLRKLADVLATELNSSSVVPSSMQDLKAVAEALQNELNGWMNEHGEVYAAGVKPMISTKRIRVYDSAWNWTLIDLLATYYDLVTGRLQVDEEEKLKRLAVGIANRSGPELLETLSYLRKRADTGLPYSLAKAFLDDLWRRCEQAWECAPTVQNYLSFMAPHTSIAKDGSIQVTEIERKGVVTVAEYVRDMGKPASSDQCPLLCIKSTSTSTSGWHYDADSTRQYLSHMDMNASSPMSFANKTVLLIGAGPSSIGAEILRCLLRGGARVIVTTSSYSLSATKFFQSIYAENGSRGSKLILVPYNQGSVRDVDSLVEWIYNNDAKEGLGWDLDYLIPFAAIGEEGRNIDGIDSRSELAHRIMLTNTVRLMGKIKSHKQVFGHHCHPTHVILPLSPNHGLFGGDGLYSESKIGLESLFGKWQSEDWGDYLSICGASIGWTRGTGLMAGNNIVAAGIEAVGVRTFSQEEMAFNLLCLMSPGMTNLCQTMPLFADLSGRFDAVEDLKREVDRIRREIQEQSELQKSIEAEDNLEAKFNNSKQKSTSDPIDSKANRRLNASLGFPKLREYSTEIGGLAQDLRDMVDLDHVMVITGFAELGPYGSSRTRWQVEVTGGFTEAGWVEMAWIMGFIKHHNGIIKGTTRTHCGWVDSATGEPVHDTDIQKRYGDLILAHTGIRAVEPELWDGYDPHKKQILQELVLEEDLPAVETSESAALEFKREHGDKVDITRLDNSQEYRVKFRRGATLMIPKAVDFHNDVAGQIPTGWDPKTYGIPEDIISQVDRTTLYALVCTVEAFLSAGITDPYEVYEHVHLSEVGNCLGSGAGGARSLSSMHKARYRDQAVQNDILQETFVNTLTAWVNMLLLSSIGPIRTPVGACATSLESLDSAHDLITSGKARICLVGGADDLEEGLAYEFANMKATMSSRDEYDKGRTPKEMSRPATTSRAGFVEAHGCGVQVVMSAQTALDMGVPIYGIVAFAGTSSDKCGRSVPAPGQGVLSNVREVQGKMSSPLLDLQFRRKTLQKRRAQIESWRQSELQGLADEAEVVSLAAAKKACEPFFDKAKFIQEGEKTIDEEVRRQERDATYQIGNAFWHKDDTISPMRGSLAVWGLTVDDITVASFHGTSTVMNEKNEMDIIQRQLAHLGRTRGNRLLGVFQKHLTGHPKGAAGAWMLNGCLQMTLSGLVPGHANADNIDENLRQFDYIAIPNRSIQTDGVRAFSVTSFGFGQKGTQAIGVHPKYLFAVIGEDEYERYRVKVARRRRVAEQYMEDGMVENKLVVLKTSPPFCGGKEGEIAAMIDPTLRLSSDSSG